MIRVLHVVPSLGADGGVQNMLYRYYNALDRTLIKFDFVVHNSDRNDLARDLEALGANVYYVTPKKKSLVKNVMEIACIIRNGNYDVVHAHQNISNVVPLILATIFRVPVKISHAHTFVSRAGQRHTPSSKLLMWLGRRLANYRFACSSEAGKWLFGKSWGLDSKRDVLMFNALDLNLYKFNPIVRREYRARLDLEDRFVLIQVGRCSKEKNQRFSIRLMERVVIEEPRAVLLLVGGGEDVDELMQEVHSKGLSAHVRYLGVRRDVPGLLCAADVMLLPSIQEGLGMVAIEAQAAGLPVIASDAVPRSTCVTDLIMYESLEGPESRWVERILAFRNRERAVGELQGTALDNYDIAKQAVRYERWLVGALRDKRASVC